MFIESKHKEVTCCVNDEVHTITFEDGLAEVSEEIGNFLIENNAGELSPYTGEGGDNNDNQTK